MTVIDGSTQPYTPLSVPVPFPQNLIPARQALLVFNMSKSSSANYIRNRVHSLPSFNSFLQGQPHDWHYGDSSHGYQYNAAYTTPTWYQDDRDMAAAASLLNLQSVGQSDSDNSMCSSISSIRTSSPVPPNDSPMDDMESNSSQAGDDNYIKKKLRSSAKSIPFTAKPAVISSRRHDKKKPRWNNAERSNLFMAIMKDKQLDNMATYNWENIAIDVGRARKACKDQWRREVLPTFIHHLKADLFQ
ncbi:hypothetical protein INT44_008898 [Umbelopsis vinacea]|uniref:Myb-like domain-containing protein n=1 Tax=Umbelopsis vinacea TaxID=44442 RepID=A0A8H7Q0X8_9FUNG|nr:hypothetical protein INT44_008898 [Umbelopsis vinacea]